MMAFVVAIAGMMFPAISISRDFVSERVVVCVGMYL